jgi:hypothetical protein
MPEAPACKQSFAARVTLGMPKWRVLRTKATLFKLTDSAVKEVCMANRQLLEGQRKKY